MNNLHSSYQKDEKEKEMEEIKYRRGVIVESKETKNERIEIDENRMGKVEGPCGRFKFEGANLEMAPRALGIFEGKAIYLSTNYGWVLCKDEKDNVCLIPLKKETD